MLLFDSNNDTALVYLLQKGDLKAFDKLYWKYHTALYNNVLKLTRDTGATEDIVQETFITLWQKRAAIHPEKSIAGWMFVISYNKAVNWQKKKLLEVKTQNNIAIKLQEETLPDLYEEQIELLENAIKQLSPQKRRVIELCKLQGKTYKETANELNISAHTVKEYLTGAMATVKEYIISNPKCSTELPILVFFSFLCL